MQNQSCMQGKSLPVTCQGRPDNPCGQAQVSEIKPVIRKELIQDGLAFAYSEPESKVVSRSGDECVVALTDQWFLTYGESTWRSRTE